MRRFLALVVLLASSLPVGLSIAGCGHNPNNYCIKNGHAYGITTSQIVYATMQPETTGISLSWGQTGSLGTPQAYNCNGDTQSVSRWTYASSNLLLADISPSGQICAGTWNRNSPGGVGNFTICTPPSGASLSKFGGCTGTTCGTVQMTATGAAVTTNPVNVYIHPPITSMTIPTQAACVSQGATLKDAKGATLPLLEETTVKGPGGVTLCSPQTTSCASPAANVGTITFSPVTSSVVTINNTTNPTNANPVTGTTSSSNPNGQATANLPGSTVINAQLANVTSAAGFFSTCPPANISLTINGGTSANVKPSSPQTIVTKATDTAGNPITGMSLNYASTEPQNLSVNATGLITATFPSHATVTGTCTPPTCNPSPINLVGTLGNGMPVTGNIVNVTSPGRSSNQIWMASSKSPFFSEVDLTTGGAATPVRLPYTPNSMIMTQAGDTLYFGSYHEMMVYSTANNSLAKEVPAVPGVVLAVDPTGSTVIVNDQVRQVIYLYNTSSGSATSVTGVANHAQFSPDGTTVYIVGQDPSNSDANTLFVHNTNTGWTNYPLSNQGTYTCQPEALGPAAVPSYNPNYDPFCGPGLTITVPSVATFLSGSVATSARSFCPNSHSTPPYYPPAGDTQVTTDKVAATPDGNHILGADGTNFSDIWITHTDATTNTAVPGVPIGACPDYTTANPLTLTTTHNQETLATLGIAPTEIDQIVSSPDSSLAFMMYVSGAGTGVLPYYQPSGTTGALGNLGTVQLSSGAQDPIAGIFSPDGTIFFASTSGDDLIHQIDTTGLKETTTIDPKLTDGNGKAVPAQFLAVKSRSTT